MCNVPVIIITGNTSARTTEGIGYTKKYEHHVKRVMSGKKMAVRGPLKMDLNKISPKWINLKKWANSHYFVPECGTLMKKHLDKKVFPAYQKCFDCVVDHEVSTTKRG